MADHTATLQDLNARRNTALNELNDPLNPPDAGRTLVLIDELTDVMRQTRALPSEWMLADTAEKIDEICKEGLKAVDAAGAARRASLEEATRAQKEIISQERRRQEELLKLEQKLISEKKREEDEINKDTLAEKKDLMARRVASRIRLVRHLVSPGGHAPPHIEVLHLDKWSKDRVFDFWVQRTDFAKEVRKEGWAEAQNQESMVLVLQAAWVRNSFNVFPVGALGKWAKKLFPNTDFPDDSKPNSDVFTAALIEALKTYVEKNPHNWVDATRRFYVDGKKAFEFPVDLLD